jgi:ABC-type molybdate transport system substrate-binding protein
VGIAHAHAQDKAITVFAAASMKMRSMTSMRPYQSALMKQIESGAPADAFVPVDLKWMDADVEKKVTP